MRIITFFGLLAIFSAVISLSSCNTIQGMGQDMESGGRVLQDAAK